MGQYISSICLSYFVITAVPKKKSYTLQKMNQATDFNFGFFSPLIMCD